MKTRKYCCLHDRDNINKQHTTRNDFLIHTTIIKIMAVHSFYNIYKGWDEKIYENKDVINVSTAIYPGSLEALNSIRGGKCILGPQYMERGKLIDWQPFVTGSPCSKSETCEHAALRELAEELGVCVVNPEINLRKIATIDVKRGRFDSSVTTFTVDAAFLRPFHASYSSQFQQSTRHSNDDKSRKVQILVFGLYDDMVKILHEISDKLPSNDTVPNEKSWISGVRMLMECNILLPYCM